jgi:hypothetical protein
MTLEEFAKRAGVKTFIYEGVGGVSVSYRTKDRPNTTNTGYKNDRAAYMGWMRNEFGHNASKAILALLKETQK